MSHLQYRWNAPEISAETVAEIMGSFGVTRPTALVLANRDIPVDAIGEFLDPRLANLVDPFLLPGLERAAERLWAAIHHGEKILVHGDYDTDGVTSTVLLTWVLGQNGAKVDFFVPNRLDDGYGLTSASVQKAVNGHQVLVSVDCGITSCDAVQTARELGVDVIVTDHHQPGSELPDAYAVINPKLHTNDPRLEPLSNLAGVGVCFKLCHAFIKYGRTHNLGGHTTDLKEGMDLVALGTVADLVPMLGENRCLVRHGIRVLSHQRRPGVRALCDVARVGDSVRCSDIAFRLAPRLNAAGRVADANSAIALLATGSMRDAHAMASNLDGYNRQRQTQEQETLDAARQQINIDKLKQQYTVVVAGRNWHLGVIGIVASRLARQFNRPALVLSIGDNGEVHGSGRSIDGVNLVEVLRTCDQYLRRFGGHPMASGLGLYEGQLAEFSIAFEEAVKSQARTPPGGPVALHIDGDIEFRELDQQFFAELTELRPFGQQHAAPVFRICGIGPSRVQSAGELHARGTLSDGSREVPFIAFNRRPESLPKAPWAIAATPDINCFRQRQQPQLQILDVHHAC